MSAASGSIATIERVLGCHSGRAQSARAGIHNHRLIIRWRSVDPAFRVHGVRVRRADALRAPAGSHACSSGSPPWGWRHPDRRRAADAHRRRRDPRFRLGRMIAGTLLLGWLFSIAAPRDASVRRRRIRLAGSGILQLAHHERLVRAELHIGARGVSCRESGRSRLGLAAIAEVPAFHDGDARAEAPLGQRLRAWLSAIALRRLLRSGAWSCASWSGWIRLPSKRGLRAAGLQAA